MTIRVILTIIFIIVAVLLVHHAMIHDGIAFQEKDFKRAVLNLLNSHEGIILLIILMGIGAGIAIAF